MKTPEAASEHTADRALIIGCGYLGAVAARTLAAAGREVWATTRSRDRWKALEGVVANLIRYDIADPDTRSVLPLSSAGDRWDVFVMLTPSTIASALHAGGGFDQLLDTVGALNPRRAVIVSSTGVYGEQAGMTVTAETPPEPSGARGQRLLEIENRWLEAGPVHRVCRLAGIYGPGRVVGRQSVVNGDTLPGDPDAWLNLIHVEDAAELAVRCATNDNARAVELGSDGEPVKRAAYYAHLATLLGARSPEFASAQRARSGSKRCDPASTMKRLDWAPQYRDYRIGLADSLRADGVRS